MKNTTSTPNYLPAMYTLEEAQALRAAVEQAYSRYEGASQIVNLLGFSNPAYGRAVEKELELSAAWQQANAAESAFFKARAAHWERSNATYAVSYIATPVAA